MSRFMNVTVVPAPWYSKDEVKDLRKAWDDGKDFKLVGPGWGGRYCSVRDVPSLYEQGCLAIYLHYRSSDKLKDVIGINLKKEYFS